MLAPEAKITSIFTPLDGVQTETINSEIPEADIAPNTPTSTQISVTGDIKSFFSGDQDAGALVT